MDNIDYSDEPENFPPSVPEKKKRTLTEKQLKNLELMRQKKMAKKQATKMIEESVRNSARDAENDEVSALRNELYEIKQKLNKKSSPREIPKKKKKRVNHQSSSDQESDDREDQEDLATSYRHNGTRWASKDDPPVNPYLHQLVRFK